MGWAALPEDEDGAVPVPGLYRDLQEALLLPPVDGQHLVALEPAQGLGEIVVQPVHRVLLGGGGGPQGPGALELLPQPLADGRVIGEGFGDDVPRPLEGLLQSLHPLLRGEVGLCQVLWPGPQPVALRVLPGKEELGQGLQALLLGHAGPGAALGPVGPVQVLHLRQGGGALDGLLQFGGQVPLLLDGGLHLPFAGRQAPQVVQPVRQGPDGLVVHGAVLLLAVAGDKGHGVALIQQGHHGLGVLRLYVELRRQSLYHLVHRVILSVRNSVPGRRQTAPPALPPGAGSSPPGRW